MRQPKEDQPVHDQADLKQGQRYVADWHRRTRKEIVRDAVNAFETDIKAATGGNKPTLK